MTNEELKKKIISVLQSVEFVTEKGWCGQCISLRLDYSAIADALIAAGYRKQSDVAKEFAKRIKDIIHRDENISNSADEYLCDEIDELAAEFGAEVEQQ